MILDEVGTKSAKSEKSFRVKMRSGQNTATKAKIVSNKRKPQQNSTVPDKIAKLDEEAVFRSYMKSLNSKMEEKVRYKSKTF